MVAIPHLPLIDVRPVDLNPAIWEAYSDPSVTNEEFETLVRSIHGDEPDDPNSTECGV